MQFGQPAFQVVLKQLVKRHFVLLRGVGSILDTPTFADNFLN